MSEQSESKVVINPENLFGWWSSLNEVISDDRARFDGLREGFPKCKSIEDARKLLRREGFAERYPKLPEEEELNFR